MAWLPLATLLLPPATVAYAASVVLASIVYSGVVSFILLKIIGAIIPLRANDEEQNEGMDMSLHGEEAYGLLGGVTTMSDHS